MLIVLFLSTFLVKGNSEVMVDLDCGRVLGTETETPLGNVLEFHQIPYGEPPVRSKRWTHSKLLEPSPSGRCWGGRYYDASFQQNPPIKCVQYWKNGSSVEGQEDCLHLTVRTPDLNPSSPLPVLVWIHGGSFLSGWSDDPGYSPDAELTADLNVVTVNINYRLDLMGFFSAPEIWNDPENPGNYGNFGIGDAITALKWVQANIAQFGGNPDSVTVLGESSGGTVALGLLVADQADGLFNTAIVLSAPAKWVSTYEDAYSMRSSFVSDVGCTQNTESARRRCLKNMDVESLIKHVDLNRGWGFYDFPYSNGKEGESMDYNVLEPTLIKVAPSELGKKKNTRNKKTKVKVILSNTAQEVGYNPLYYDTNVIDSWKTARSVLKKKLEKLHNETGFRVRDSLQESIEEMYDYGQTEEGVWWPQLYYDTLTTDTRTTCITNDLTEDLNDNPLYQARRMYVKSRPDEMVETNSTVSRPYQIVSLPYETIHGWDTEALFGYGWFRLASSSQRHQRKFEENIRDLVHYLCYDMEIEGWEEDTTLVFENDDFPEAVRVDKHPPQYKECKFWERKDMLQWGWQN